MLDWASSELVGVLYYLLPGFVAAWIFHSLTAHPRRSSFEQIIQALIFTAIIQVVVSMFRGLLFWVGEYVPPFTWTDERAFGFAVFVAAIVGLLFAILANNDWLFWLLRQLEITKRQSYPSEWFGSFSEYQRYIVLHLKGGRRLYGWPSGWPDRPTEGSFVMAKPQWLLDDNQCVPLHGVKRMLIAASDVEMVEVLNFPSEIDASPDQLESSERILVKLQTDSGTKDGNQRSEADDQVKESHNEPA